ELLYQASLFPELELTFKHALTHEVAYGSLLQDRRRGLHGRLMEAIERLYADRLAEQTERLAHHALRGERWMQAVSYCRQAGTRATERVADREAADHFERALLALGHLPDGQATLELAFDIRLELFLRLWVLREIERCSVLLQDAEALAHALGDSRR